MLIPLVLSQYMETGDRCHCRSLVDPNGACQTCDHYGGPANVDRTVCVRCGDSMYHSASTKTCITKSACLDLDMIPTGSTTNGRICVAAPLHCRKQKILTTERRGKPCSCGSDDNPTDKKNCAECTWDKDGKSICLMCMNGMYLHDGRCVEAEACPQELSRFGVSNNKRVCRAPFICTAKKDGDGQTCGKCTDRKYCRSCKWEAGNKAGFAPCIKCRGKRVPDPISGMCILPM